MNTTKETSVLSMQPKVKCFGSHAALCAEATFTSPESGRTPTINLEVAPRKGPDVIWDRKIIIQLSDSELPIVCSVLMGYLPRIHLKRPGRGIEMERQPNKIFVKASSGTGNLFVLPISIGDTFRLTSLLLKQLSKQSGLEDENLILAALRGAASLYKVE